MALTKIDDRGLKTPIDLLDNEKIRLGTGNDLEIYHDGSDSYIDDSGTGDLCLRSSTIYLQKYTGENCAKFVADGACELYYNNVKKLATTGDGIKLNDSTRIGLGDSEDLLIYHNGSDSYVKNSTGDLYIRDTDGNIFIQPKTDENAIKCVADGQVELYHDNSKKLETTSSGATISGANPVLELAGTASTSGNTFLHINANANHWCVGADNYSSQNLFVIKDGTPSSSTHRFAINASGNVGIGTTSPGTNLHVKGSGEILRLETTAADGGQCYIDFDDETATRASIGLRGSSSDTLTLAALNSTLRFDVQNKTQAMNIDADGKVGIGTASPNALLTLDTTNHYVVTDSGKATSGIHLKGQAGNAGEYGGAISFATGDTGASAIAAVQTHADSDANALSFFTHTSTTGATDSAERMRVGMNSASVYIGKVTGEVTIASGDASFTTGCGVTLCGGNGTGHYNIFTSNDQTTMFIGRQTTDGNLMSFQQSGSTEGTISVSGSTVSYNGGHLSRWSQLTGISSTDKSKRPTIYQGTVMSNLDELCSWSHPDVLYTEEEETKGEIPDGKKVGDVKIAAYTEENQQLNMTKVSDVVGDKNVAGVFWTWDDDDDEIVNDFYVAMTGDMVIRVAASTTVARGDLLISAGDGTAKPQADDIIRSSTIAKIISTNHTATYADGSKAYPCVLMAC